MLENNQDMLYDDHSKTFCGVYFVLLGFDLTAEEKIRSKLIDGGGVDVGRVGPDCTHVIVGRLVYDDPECVTARKEGKILVTGLWVDHSFDIGMPVDPATIMYRPLRDLNGIPGAKSLLMCLTGYQRQDREDIMTMVGLMGANFSKPLIANKVTHLICYKFEGEKYELAKKMMKIKLVNHRWLEDCLRTWELLPEVDYDKSGHELETIEAQAKDSEDEAEDMAKRQEGERGIVATPQSLQCGLRSPSQALVMMQEASRNTQGIGASNKKPDAGNTEEVLLVKEKETTPTHTQLKETPNQCSEISGSTSIGISGKMSSGTPSNSGNISSYSVSASKIIGNSHLSSTSKLHSACYSRRTPTRGCLPANISPSAKLQVGDALNMPPFHIEHERTCIDGEDALPNRTPCCPNDAEIITLPEKRKIVVSGGSSTLQKSHDSEFVLDCALGEIGTEMPQPTSSIQHRPDDTTANHSPQDNHLGIDADLEPHPFIVSGIVTPKKKSHDSEFALECALGAIETDMPRPTSPILHGPDDSTAYHSPHDSHLGIDANLEPHPFNVSGIITPMIVKDCSEQEPQTSRKKLKSTNMASKSPKHIHVMSNAPEDTSNGATEPHQGPQDLNVPSSGAERLGNQKSALTVNMEFPVVGDDHSRPKPFKRKLLSRKAYLSKPGFGGRKVLNKKGSIFMKQKILPDDSATRSTMEEEPEDLQRPIHSEALVASPNCNVDQAKNVDMKSISQCGNQTPNKLGLVDNEVVTSEEKENAAVGKVVAVDTHAPNEVGTSKSMDDNIVDMIDQTVVSVGEGANMEAKNVASDRKLEMSKLNLEEISGGAKKNSSKRCPLVEIKKKKLSPVTNSKKGVPKKGANCKSRSEEAKGRHEKEPLADRNMKPRSEDSGKPSSQDMEKGNRPVNVGGKNLNHNKKVGKVTPNSDRKRTESESGNPDLVTVGMKEPAWFILSGHKLQRKEFQQVIKRLKGRLCRDTHQWSYQATHFIVPDPIRRTEKFFAAAASGRWVLKTDYLTACNEAGKFLAEEPFEWHKKGLSEDGAVNLEAPRKWRLLRERTGHGALYGLRIIIYGDCIVPPLDTLKRVVKAGDGTILATSPPYTRFLQSDMDFAIISPGMPHVDIWIQEFLRHEIPCISADYLVEYVCKPGYSLDRHVQYNTHAWAEKSFKRLESRMNEIAEDTSPQNDNDNGIADIPCQVCGSCDRGEVLLICGNEEGSKGCGIGTHIDCCDPPFQEVPKEDWYCSKCSSQNTKKMGRKLTSTSKRKR